MIEAVILYGSRARRDGQESSDTDILGVCRQGKIRKPFDDVGISFHVYPLEWMIEQSYSGSLFLLHISTEAMPIFDPQQLLKTISREFKFKMTYQNDIEIGSRIVAATTRLASLNFSEKMRARYFWGLRTALMGTAAEARQAVFSSKSLQEYFGIDGLAAHLQSRKSAKLNECIEVGATVLKKLGGVSESALYEDPELNLAILKKWEGIASATAGDIIYGL